LPEPLAVVDSVTKHYRTEAGHVTALHAIDAVVPEGAVTALVGVSGSGKSTLLRLLGGHELASSGTVRVGGADLASLDTRELRRFRREEVTYVSQRAADNLFPHLTIAEHAPEAAREIFERLGVAHRLNARPSQLSGGELARAAFAVALARSVPLVIVDEPTAELDHTSAALLLEAIRSLAAGGTTFLVATHDPAVLAIADNLIELEHGRNAVERHEPPPPPAVERGAVVLSADGLGKTYDAVPVVVDATLELRAGELAAIVGRSGSGKSTLLMLLGGWQQPDTGTLDASTEWNELAYVPQRFGLVPELTVRENVNLPARLARVDGATDEWLERLALAELVDRYPNEISIGQQQRVGVARALCIRPRVLLVDEPTSHQDGASAERVWSALAEATAQGTACLVATHEPDATRRAHIAWQIEAGRLTRV
jgi:putative ABC transport system ATP-binding protein